MTGAPTDFVPFNQPTIAGRELELIQKAVHTGHTSADGPISREVAAFLRDVIGAEDVLLTTSCTAALEMSAMLLRLEPGDRVVVPSFGFVTTALAFAREGAEITFCDIEPETLGLDPGHLEQLMDDRVRAVVPIHYAGVPCRIKEIREVVASWPRAEVIEDNAHGLFGTHHGRPLGSFGRFSTLSFHETKNFICGEGGALVLNDPTDIERAHVLYDKGTDRRAFMLGHVDKYSWQDTGSSFGLSEVLAAYLLGQLEQRDRILTSRRAAFERYSALVGPLAGPHGLTLPTVPEGCEPAYHMFHLLLPDADIRNRVLASMNEHGVYATFHYVPLHSSSGGRQVAAYPTECPVTEEISGRLLRLPFFTGITAEQTETVVHALQRALAT